MRKTDDVLVAILIYYSNIIHKQWSHQSIDRYDPVKGQLRITKTTT